MKIGVCTTDFSSLPCDELFSRMKNHGFDSTQFSFVSVTEADFIPTGQIEIPDKILPSTVKTISNASKKHDIRIAACNGTFNMSHPDKAVRDEGIKRFDIFTSAVRDLGCPKISLCSGTLNANDLWSYHTDNNTKTAWDNLIYTLERIVPLAQQKGLVLAVETEAANIIDTPEKARLMMEAIGSNSLKMIMDCANLFHSGKAKKENVAATLTHAFDVFGSDTVIAHGKDIAESDGINFCPTGEGIIDFVLFINQLKKYSFHDDMMLHGIYDESKMAAGIQTIKNAL